MEHFSHTIKLLADDDKPREKLLSKGKSALSDAELIAVLLGSGTRELNAVELARVVLQKANNDLNALAKLTVSDLTKIKGIGDAKAISIVCALEIGRRRNASEPMTRSSIRSSNDAYQILKPYMLDLQHEEFWIIMLTRANQVMGVESLSSGGMTGTVVDAKMVFKKALDARACSIVVAHNHPSGNTSPSDADKKITRQLVEAGKLLEITVLDHIIFTDHSYFSFADENMLC